MLFLYQSIDHQSFGRKIECFFGYDRTEKRFLKTAQLIVITHRCCCHTRVCCSTHARWVAFAHTF